MNRDIQAQALIAHLHTNSHDLGAIARLEAMFSPESWEPLVELLFDAASQATTDLARGRFLLESSKIALVYLDNAALAGDILKRASTSAQGTGLEGEIGLFDIAVHQTWDGLEPYFSAADAATGEDVQAKSRLYSTLGYILEHSIGDNEQASEMYRYAAELDPSNSGVLLRRKPLLEASEDWAAYSALVILQLNVAKTPEEQIELMLDLGEVSLRTGAREQAQQCFQNVYDFDSTNQRARHGLSALGIDTAEPKQVEHVEEPDSSAHDVVELLDSSADDLIVALDESADNLVAAMSSEATLDPPSAPEIDLEEISQAQDEDLNAPVESALESEPAASEAAEDALIVEEIEEVEEVVAADEVAAVDEDVAVDELIDDVVAVDEAMAVDEDVVADIEEEEQAPAQQEHAELEPEVHALQEASEASEPLEEQVEEQAVAPIEEEEEEELLEASISWQARVGQLLEAFSAESGEDAHALLRTAARKEWTQRDGREPSEQAQQIWAAALAASPNAAALLYEEFNFRYSGESFWTGVAAQAESAQGHELLRAKIAAYHTHDLEQARLLAEATEDAHLLQVLDDVEPSIANWRKHQRDVEARFELDDADAKNIALYTHMLDVAQAMGDDDKCFDMLRRLDRLSDDLAIKGQLQEVYLTQEKWPAYVDLVKQEAAALGDEAQESKVDLWQVAIDVYIERMRNDMQAINLYKEILEAQPDNLPMIDALIALYNKNNRASDEIALMQQKVDLISSKRQKIALLGNIATIYAERFRNQAEAMKAYEAILALDSSHSDAVVYLKEMYEKRREWDKLIELYTSDLQTVEDPAAKIQTLKFVADLAANKKRDIPLATSFWSQALELAPSDLSIVESLEAAHEKARDHDALTKVLELKVDLIDDAQERLKIFQKMGLLYTNHIEGGEDAAINAYARALALDPTNRRVRLPLENLYVEHGRWEQLEALYASDNAYDDLAKTLESLVSKQKDDASKIELLLRASDVSVTHLQDHARAQRNLERIHQQFDPQHERTARALVEIYAQTRDLNAMQNVLRIILEHQSAPEDRRPVQRKLSGLAEAGEDFDSAFAWNAQILREDITQLADTSELERTAARSDSWDLVVDIYKDILGQDIDKETSKNVRMKLGLVLAQHLGQYDQAQGMFEAILEEDQSHDGALAAMEHIFRHQERWDDLLGVYERRLSLVEDPATRVQVLQGMAQLAEQQAGNPTLALEKYLDAYVIEPKNLVTLTQLHRLYCNAGQHTEQANIIRQEIALIHEQAATRSTDVASGKIDASSLVPESSVAEDLSGPSSESSSSVSEGEESEPLDTQQVGLGEMSSSDVEDAAAQGLPLYTDDELDSLTQLHLELGHLCVEHLNTPKDAVESFTQALRIDPKNAQAVGALESMAPAHEALAGAIAHTLTQPYELGGRWEDLLGVLHTRAKDTDDAHTRAALFSQIGHVHVEELGQAKEGFVAYASALRAVPQLHDVRAQLARLTAVLDTWPELIALYEEILPELGFDAEPLRLDYLYELGRINATRLEDADRAELHYQSILEVAPEQTQALDELEDLYSRTEQWRSMLDVYDRRKALDATPEGKLAMDFKTAAVWESMLQDYDKAIATYQGILQEHPGEPHAMASLERIYRDQGLWTQLVENLAYEYERAPADQKLTVKHRMAEAYELQVGDASKAVDLYEEILHDERLNEATLASLKRVMHSDDEVGSKRASVILEPLFEETGRMDALIESLYVQVERGDEPETQRQMLHRIAAISEHQLNDAQGAFNAFGHALRYGPEDTETLAELDRLSQITLDHENLVRFYEEAALHIEDEETKRDVLRRAASIYIDKLSDVTRAAERLSDVLVFRPDDMESIDELIQIHQYTEEWEAFGQILMHKAQQLHEGDEQKPLLFQASTVYREFIDLPERAVEANTRILEIDPVDLDAIQNLEHLYTRLERWNELLDIFTMRLDLADSDDTRKELLFVVGAIHQQELEQPHDAIRTYQRILELDPHEVNALIKLEELYEQTEAYDDLLDVLGRQIDLSQDNDARNNLRFRLGQVLQSHHDDVPGAISSYQQVLSVDPNHSMTLQALEEIIVQGQYVVEAADVLQPVFDSLESWDDLIRIYHLRLDHAQDPQQKLEFLGEIASIEEGCKDDKIAAFKTYSNALVLDPSKPQTLSTLERLTDDIQAWDAFIDHLDAIIDGSDDPVVQATLQRSIARVYEERIQDPDSAIDRYIRVLEKDDQDESALGALSSLYQTRGKWQDLTEILEKRIELSSEPVEQLQQRLQLATVQRSMLEKPEDALETYRTILGEDPDQSMAIEGLEDMYMDGQQTQAIAEILEPHYLSRGEHESLINLYRQRLEHLADPQERFGVLRQIARIYSDAIQDDRHAMAYLGEALVQYPSGEGILDDLDAVAERLEEQMGAESWTELTSFYMRALQAEGVEDAISLTMWLRLAQIIDERLKSPESAEVAYSNALTLDPGDATALQALDRIYLQGERFEELAGILERRIVEGTDDDLIVELSMRQGNLYKDTLLDRAQAINAYERVLAIEPEHVDALKALEPLYTAEGRVEDLYRILELQSQLTYDGAEQSAYFMRMAQLNDDNLERRDEAIRLLNEVIGQQPENIEALSKLRRLYLMEERWDEMVDIIAMEIDLTQEDEERLGLYENLGVILTERLNDEPRALDAWSSALQIDPTYLPALDALRDIYTSRGDYVERSAVLSRILEHPELDATRRLDLWVEQADIQGNMLMEPEDAIKAWQQVLALSPGDARAIDSLELLFDEQGRWEELIAVLEVKADNLYEQPEQRLGILRKLADRSENKLQDIDRAAGYQEQIMGVVGFDQDAYEVLERTYRQQATEASFTQLVGLYLDRAGQVSEDAEARTAVLRLASNVFEQELDSAPNALVVLLSALTPESITEEDLFTEITRLAQLNEEKGQPAWGDVVNRYAELLPTIEDNHDAYTLNFRIGELLATRLSQPDDAIYYLQRAHQYEPDQVEVLVLLAQLYEQLAAWEEFTQIKLKQVEATQDPDDKCVIWRRLGSLYESQLADPDKAITAYEHILALDPNDSGALNALERIYDVLERWESLIDILRQKAQASYEPEEVIAIQHRIAGLYRDQLQEPARAISAYLDVMESDQTNLQGLQSLESLYRQQGDADAVLDNYTQQLKFSSDTDAQISIYGKMANDQEEIFERKDEAIEAYIQILGLDPEHLGAIESLERLYEETERWFDLVEILESHINLVPPSDKVRLLNHLARVQRNELNDPHAAIDAFVRSIDADSRQPDIYTELGALYEQTESWESAIEVYRSHINVADAGSTRITLLLHIGQLYEQNLYKDEDAEAAYLEVLKSDQGNQDALNALRAFYERRFDWQGVIRVLKQSEEHSRDLTHKAAMMSAIGNVYKNQLEDMVSAVRYFEQAQEFDPNIIESAEPLIDVYIVEQRYERALPLLRTYFASTAQEVEPRPPEIVHARMIQMAQTTEHLGLFDEALEYYHRSYEIDPTSMTGLIGLGGQLYRNEDYEQALKIYQSLQLQHLERLTHEQARDLFFHCGMIKQRVGDRRRAAEFFEGALEYQPGHRPTLMALLENYEAAGMWDRYIQLQRNLASTEQNTATKYSLLTRIGDVYLNNIKDIGSAVTAYLEALDLNPESVVTLRKLLNIFTSNRRWLEAVDMMQRMIGIEQDPATKAKMAYTIGVIYRDNIRDPKSAVAPLSMALDLDINYLKAFEAINRILTDLKDWKGLEHAYRDMLKRLSKHAEGNDEKFGPIKYMLWEGLGEIYRSRLKHLKSAIQAFEMASELNPDSEKVHLILAELYDLTEDATGSIKHHRRIILNDPFKIDSYRSLFKAYFQSKSYDKAWCMASALCFLNSANETEQRFYQEYLGSNLRPARSTFNPETIRMVYHSEQDMLITTIMQQLYYVFAPAYAKDLRDLGVHKKKDLLDPNVEQLHFCKIYNYVSSRLAPVGLMPIPMLYQRRTQALGLANATTWPTSFLVGADMFQGKDERELAFNVSKRLGWMMPQHYLGFCGYPTEWLKSFFMAAMHITDPSLGLDRTLGENGATLIQAIQDADRQQPGLMLQIQKLMRQFLNSGRNPNLSHWLTTVDYTSSRLGLLLCGDLKSAVVGVKNDPRPIGKATIKDRVRELVLFSISEEYFELRARLGLAIGS